MNNKTDEQQISDMNKQNDIINNSRDGVLLSGTKSVCPVCLTRLDAYYSAYEDGVFLEKTCPEHGGFRIRVWDEPLDFLKWKTRVGQEPELNGDCPNECGLCNNHIQETCCVLLEVTGRCELGCPVCFASSGSHDSAQDPDILQIAGWYDMLMEKGGPFNIQLSGGEPTMRDDLPEIIRIGKEKGFSFFQLNTNGLRIASDDGYIEKLASAGLSTVFLQFDGFSEKTDIILRGRSVIEDKLEAVRRCREARIGVVLVPTVVRGVNDTELGAIMNYAAENMPIVRGVHFQPISLFGRYLLNSNSGSYTCVESNDDNRTVSGIGSNDDYKAVSGAALSSDARVTIPELLESIENQTEGKVLRKDFSPSNAEHPLCGFHADYTVMDGVWKLIKGSNEGCSCGVSSMQARTAVARKWKAPDKIVTAEKLTDNEASLNEGTAINKGASSNEAMSIGKGAGSNESMSINKGASSNESTDARKEKTENEAMSFDEFIAMRQNTTLAVSGMAFQDAYTMDLNRLRRCYIHIVSQDGRLIPFCSCNLSTNDGKTLYR